MKLGFTFDEKALNNIGIEDWLSHSKSLGASAIELSPDKNILPLSTYGDIAKAASHLNMDINYHIPYFASEHYSIECFSKRRAESKSKYEDFFSILEYISSILDRSDSTIVVHGEEFLRSSEKSLNSTVEFLKYLSDSLHTRDLDHRIAIETLRLGSSEKVGNNRAELIHILSLIKDKRVGLCLDICHDALNYFPSPAPFDPDFYENIIYSHIHGYDFSSGKNHISVFKSSLSYLDQILHLTKTKPDITLNLESLSDFVGTDYLSELFCDLENIHKLI